MLISYRSWRPTLCLKGLYIPSLDWWPLISINSSFRKQEKGFKRKGLVLRVPSPLHRIKWKRIVLDEAHNIKERSTNTAKAAFELQAEYRWCLSGTPIQNRVGELYSLMRFLGGDPFSYYFCASCLHRVFTPSFYFDDCFTFRQALRLQIVVLDIWRQQILSRMRSSSDATCQSFVTLIWPTLIFYFFFDCRSASGTMKF